MGQDALREFKEKIIDLFIGHGCQTIQDVDGYYYANSGYRYAKSPSFVVKTYDSLMEFVKKNDIEKVRNALETGYVNVDEKDKVGNTLLMRSLLNKNNKMARLLLDYGANPTICSSIDRTALDIAIENGDDEIAELLIQASDAF